jgi:hypothetical protein
MPRIPKEILAMSGEQQVEYALSGAKAREVERSLS